MIYVLGILNETFVKVGYAENIKERISTLQTGNPFELELIFSVDGNIYQEQEIHKTLSWAFKRSNITYPPNEWYVGKHPIMTKFLCELKFGANQALAYLDKFSRANRNLAKKYGDDIEERLMDYPETDRKFIQKAVRIEMQCNGV